MNTAVQSLIRYVVRWSDLMGSFSARWNYSANKIEEIPKGFKHRWKWTLAKFLEFSYFVYLLIITIVILKGPNEQLKEIGEVLYKMIELAMRLTVELNYSMKVKDAIYFPNCVMESLRHFQDRYKMHVTRKKLPIKLPNSRVSAVQSMFSNLELSDKILFNAAISFGTYPLLALGHNLMFPAKPLYISYVVYQINIKIFDWLYIPIAILNFWLSCVIWSGTLFITFASMPHVIAVIKILDEIRWRPNKKLYKTKPSLRQPMNLCITVRQIQLTFTILYSLFRGNFLALTFLVMYYFVASVSIVAKCRSELPQITILVCTLSSIGCVVVILLIFILLSSVYQRTERCLNSWRNFTWPSKNDRVIMRKFRKSVYPVLFHNGSYVVRPKRVLTYINSVIWSCLKSLISL